MGTEKRLRALMERHGWTQHQAAAQLGVNQSWISRVLTGRSQNLDIFDRVVIRLAELERLESEQAPQSVAS